MRRGDLTDEQWHRLEPLLPPEKPHTGRPNEDHRQILNGILWIHRTGAPWRDLPRRYGPVGTVSSRFYRWRKAGIWQRILSDLQAEAEQRGEIDWDLPFVDATIVRAHAALGISLNNLSLFGLVLAVGIVVDDAIVVVENVERNIGTGLSPAEAAHRTMDEVGGALVSIALTLCAVFVPAAFLSGISGQFFRQFAVTISASTVISCFVSLTLSPALCAILFKPHDPHEQARAGLAGRIMGAGFSLFNRGFDWLSDRYGRLTRRLVRGLALVLVVYIGLIGVAGVQFARTPTG